MAASSGRVALVTGAGRGIGRAIATALAAAGHHVLINYRSRETDAQATLDAIQADGNGTGELAPFDISDPDASNTALSELVSRHGHIDILVNNAGVRSDSLLVFMKREQWSDVLTTNLDSFYNVTQPIVKQMAMNRWGRIVNIASTAGQTGVEGQTNYAAAKAGLIGATKALAREVAKRGVTVNALAPGFIETEMLEGMERKQILAQIPAARLGRPEDVAAAAAFLCSDAASYITGAVLNINGGIHT